MQQSQSYLPFGLVFLFKIRLLSPTRSSSVIPCYHVPNAHLSPEKKCFRDNAQRICQALVGSNHVREISIKSGEGRVRSKNENSMPLPRISATGRRGLLNSCGLCQGSFSVYYRSSYCRTSDACASNDVPSGTSGPQCSFIVVP